MHTSSKKSTKLEGLKIELSGLVAEYGSKTSSDCSYKEFKASVDRLLEDVGELNSTDLAALIEYGAITTQWDGEDFYWDLAMTFIESQINGKSAAVAEEGNDEEEESEEEPAEEDEDEPSISRSGWISTFCEMSKLQSYLASLRKMRGIGCLFKFEELAAVVKSGFKSILKFVVQAIRFITFADALDRFAKWIKSNHSHRQAVVEFATLIDAIVKLVTYALFIIVIFLRPDKYLRKLLPDEITDSLPTD